MLPNIQTKTVDTGHAAATTQEANRRFGLLWAQSAEAVGLPTIDYLKNPVSCTIASKSLLSVFVFPSHSRHQ
jgi:hypothetical protein